VIVQAPSRNNVANLTHPQKTQSANSFILFRAILLLELDAQLTAGQHSSLASGAWAGLYACEALQWRIMSGDIRVLKNRIRARFPAPDDDGMTAAQISSANQFAFDGIDDIILKWGSDMLGTPSLYTHGDCCRFAIWFSERHRRARGANVEAVSLLCHIKGMTAFLPSVTRSLIWIFMLVRRRRWSLISKVRVELDAPNWSEDGYIFQL
jgi:hypothetical protein